MGEIGQGNGGVQYLGKGVLTNGASVSIGSVASATVPYDSGYWTVGSNSSLNLLVGIGSGQLSQGVGFGVVVLAGGTLTGGTNAGTFGYTTTNTSIYLTNNGGTANLRGTLTLGSKITTNNTATITVNGGSTFIGGLTLGGNITSNTIINDSNIVTLGGGTLVIGGTLAAGSGTSESNSFVWTGGTLGVGTVTATSAGWSVPTSSIYGNTLYNTNGTFWVGNITNSSNAGKTIITGNYSQSGNGTTTFNIFGTNQATNWLGGPTNFSFLSVSQTATLGGTIALVMTNFDLATNASAVLTIETTANNVGSFTNATLSASSIVTGTASLSTNAAGYTNFAFLNTNGLSVYSLRTTNTSISFSYVGTNQWQGGGSWGTGLGTPWSGGYNPSSSSAIAYFGTNPNTSVTVDKNVTIGGLIFTNSSGYTLTASGSSTITVLSPAGPSGTVGLTNQSGNQTINVPLNLASSLEITNSTGSQTVTLAGGISGSGGIIIDSGFLGLSNTPATTISNVISGAGGVTKIGAGTLTLTGTNIYTGATVINAGALTIGGNGQLGGGNYGGGITIATNSSFNYISSNYQTLYGGINGQGSLTKSGSGSLYLTASNSYGGGSIINGGLLSLSDSNAIGTGGFKITNATLSTAGLLNGTVNMWGAGMTLQGNSTIVIASTGVYPSFTNVGTLTLGGANNTITNSLLPTNTVTLIGATNIQGTSLQYLIGSQTATLNSGQPVINGRTTYSLITNNSSIQLVVGGGAWNLSWTGSNNNIWDTNSTNWYATNASGGTAFYPSDNVLFTNLSSSTNIGVTNSGVVAGTMLISSNSNNITFTNGSITATSLTISSNSGTITFSNASVTNTGMSVIGSSNVVVISPLTVNGSVSVSGSTLILSGAGASTLNDGNLTISNAGTLINNTSLLISNPASIANTGGLILASGTLSGSGTMSAVFFNVTNGLISSTLAGGGILTKNGNGTVTLLSSNNFSGGVKLLAGQLNLNNSNALGGGIFTISGGQIDNTSGAFIMLSTNAQVWNGNFTFVGTTNLTLGTGPVTLMTNSKVTINSNRLVVGGNIGGNYTLTKDGSGTLSLTGTNTYTGATVISNGVLSLFGAGQLGGGSYGSSITIASNSSFRYDSSANQSLSGGISGAGSLTVLGTGTLVLASSNNYTGGTFVSGGTLSVSNSRALGTGGVTVTNSTLSFTNLPNSTVNLGGTTINLIGAATLSITSDGTMPSLSNIGTLNLSGYGNVISNAAFITNIGTYSLISASSISGTNLGYLVGSQTATLSGASADLIRTSYNLTNNANLIQLLVSGGPWNISWTGSNNNTWDTNSTNWYATNSGGKPTTFVAGDSVLFTNLPSITNIVVTNSGVVAGSMLISSNSNNISFISGSISATSLTISNNSGRITFNNDSVNVTGVGLTNSSNTGLTVIGSSNVVMNSPLTVTNGGGVTVNGATLTLAGAGASSVYDDNVNVMNGGILSNNTSLSITNPATNANTGGLILGDGTIGGSGTIYATFFNVTNGLISTRLSGIGILTKSGSGTVTLSGQSSYTGGTQINGGTLVISNPLALGANGSLNIVSGVLSNSSNLTLQKLTLVGGAITGSGTITFSSSFTTTNSGALFIPNTLAGTGIFTQSGTGTTTLYGSNSYSGGTFVTSGSLVITNNNALGSGNGPLNIISGILSNNGFNAGVGVVTLGNATIAGDGTLTGTSFTATNSGTLIISNSLAGAGTFTQGGAGTTSLYGSNSYAGGTIVTTGKLLATTSNSLSTNNVTVSGGILDLGGANVFTNNFYLQSGTIQGGGISNDISFSGFSNGTVSSLLIGQGSLVKNGSGALTLSGYANSYSGGTYLLGGTLVSSNQNSLSTGDVSVSGGVLNLGGFVYSNNFALNGGLITNGAISNNLLFDQLNSGTNAASLVGSGALGHAASGTLTLSGANKYTGGNYLTGGIVVAMTTNALGAGGKTTYGGTSITNATLYYAQQSNTLTLGNGIALQGSATVTLAYGSSVTNKGGISITYAAPSLTNIISLDSTWSTQFFSNNVSGTYDLISGKSAGISGANSNSIALQLTAGGTLYTIPFGTTKTNSDPGYAQTYSFIKSSHALQFSCYDVWQPIQTIPKAVWYRNDISDNTRFAATNGGVREISAAPFNSSDLSVVLNGYGQVVVVKPKYYNVIDPAVTNVPAAASNGVTRISAGYSHVMALKNGAVIVWPASEVSDSPPGITAVSIPTPASASNGVVEISAGAHSCLALKSDGTMVAWGYKYAPVSGILPYKVDLYKAAVTVATLRNVIGIADGLYNGLALLRDGTVVGFGQPFDTTKYPFPADAGVEVNDLGLTNVAAISLGETFAMALKKDGTVVAWGNNGVGQTTVPSGLSGVISISAGADYALALKADGSVVAWGNPAYTNVPKTLLPVAAIEAGNWYSLVARTNNGITPLDDCHTAGGLKGGGGGNSPQRNLPVSWSTPAPRSTPAPLGSSGSSGTQPVRAPQRVLPAGR